MPLPMFTNVASQKHINYEPIYNNFFEVIIKNDNIDFILEDVVNINYVNGSLIISVRYENTNDNMVHIKKYFREDKISRLLDGVSNSKYRIILSMYNSSGMVIKIINLSESKFIGLSDNMLHFSYKEKKEEYFGAGGGN